MNALRVNVGDGALMTFPAGELCHRMRYGVNKDYAAAEAIESFRYLVLECTKEEAWRRIRLMRAAVKSHEETSSRQDGLRS